MKKVITAVLFSLVSIAVQAQEVKTYLIPFIPNKEIKTGVMGHDENGPFICKGTVTPEERNVFSVAFIMLCNGEKVSLKDFVKEELKGTYIASNYVYENPRLYDARTNWMVSSKSITGLAIYFK